MTVVIPNLAVPRCSNCGELVFDYTADQQIRAAFRDQFGLPEPVASTTTEQPAIGSNHITANHEPGVVVPGKGKPG